MWTGYSIDSGEEKENVANKKKNERNAIPTGQKESLSKFIAFKLARGVSWFHRKLN